MINLMGAAGKHHNPATKMDYFLQAIGENYTYSSTGDYLSFSPSCTRFLDILAEYTKSNGGFTETQKFKLMRIWDELP